jgi:uncharacterized membrane protein
MASTQTTVSGRPESYRVQPRRPGASGVNVGTTERWISLIAGVPLTCYGLVRLGFGGITLVLLGGSAIYRGVTGHSLLYQALEVNTATKRHSTLTTLPDHQGIRVQRSMTVNRAPEALYNFWNNVENMPLFMLYVESVRSTGSNRSHWVAKTPIVRTRVEWDSEVTENQENRFIAWRTLEDMPIAHAGSVRFEPAAYGHETIVTLTLEFRQRGGAIGESVAKFLGYVPERLTQEDLRRFKELMEAGEIAQSESRPSGRSNVEAAQVVA